MIQQCVLPPVGHLEELLLLLLALLTLGHQGGLVLVVRLALGGLCGLKREGLRLSGLLREGRTY